MRSSLFPIFLILHVLIFSNPVLAGAEDELITVFVPSVPGIEKLLSENAGEAKKKGQKSIWKDDNVPEADILMSLIQPYSYKPQAMDMPQSFAMIFQPDSGMETGEEAIRRDLLGDVEEIRYLDNKAWGANVALAEPGLYQFILEAKPFWNQEKNEFLQQNAKLFLPVLSAGRGWDKALSQGLEIVPLTRPYGLIKPAFFSGRVLNNGKAVPDVRIRAARLNADKSAAPNRWSRDLETRTDSEGIFSLLLNEGGWWFCEAITDGEPLKGPDGQMKETQKSAILWLYVGP